MLQATVGGGSGQRAGTQPGERLLSLGTPPPSALGTAPPLFSFPPLPPDISLYVYPPHSLPPVDTRVCLSLSPTFPLLLASFLSSSSPQFKVTCSRLRHGDNRPAGQQTEECRASANITTAHCNHGLYLTTLSHLAISRGGGDEQRE